MRLIMTAVQFLFLAAWGFPGTGRIYKPSVSPSGFNLEVPIDLIGGSGLVAPSTGSTVFLSTQTSFDPSYYNGTLNYYFEAVGENTDCTTLAADLLDPSSNAIATVQIPAGTSLFARARSAFTGTPTAGTYTIRVNAPTSGTGTCKITAARIIVKQTGATKTRVYISLLAPIGSASSPQDMPQTVISDTAYQTAAYGMIWKREDAAWGNLAATSPWKFEAVVKCSSAARTCYAGLTDTSGNVVNEATTSSTTPTLISGAAFASTTTNFVNLGEYQVRTKINNAGGGATSALYKAGLWVELSSIVKGELYYNTLWQNLVYLDTSTITNASVYHESTGVISAGSPSTCHFSLKDIGTSDAAFGGSGTVLSGSGVYYNSTTLARARVGPLTITSGNRFINQRDCPTGSNTPNGSYIVIKFQ